MLLYLSCFFFFNDTATTEIYTLSLHDALPISEPEVLEGSDHVSDVDQLLGLVEHHDDAHGPNEQSAECGIRNAECKGGRFIPRAPAPRTAPDPAGLRAATPSRCRRSTRAAPPGGPGREASR